LKKATGLFDEAPDSIEAKRFYRDEQAALAVAQRARVANRSKDFQ
jgi:hypothetical protein